MKKILLILPHVCENRIRSALEAHNRDMDRTVDFLVEPPPNEFCFPVTDLTDSAEDALEELQILKKKCDKYRKRIQILTGRLQVLQYFLFQKAHTPGGFGWKAYQRTRELQLQTQATVETKECKICFYPFSKTVIQYKLSCKSHLNV